MKRFPVLIAVATLAMATSLPAWAQNPAAIKANVERLTAGKVKVDQVQATPAPGIFQVISEGEIFYTDATGRYGLVGGALVDMQTQQDLTAPAVEKLTAVPFASLPLKHAIKQVRGNGKRVIASFEDPNCGYCKRLAKDLQGLKDATVYTFLYPILSPDSTEKSKNIWCAKDKAAAWNDWMVGGKAPASAAAGCDTSAIDKNVALGQKIKVTGTPTIFTADGNRLPGAVPLAQLEQAMNQAGAK